MQKTFFGKDGVLARMARRDRCEDVAALIPYGPLHNNTSVAGAMEPHLLVSDVLTQLAGLDTCLGALNAHFGKAIALGLAKKAIIAAKEVKNVEHAAFEWSSIEPHWYARLEKIATLAEASPDAPFDYHALGGSFINYHGSVIATSDRIEKWLMEHLLPDAETSDEQKAMDAVVSRITNTYECSDSSSVAAPDMGLMRLWEDLT